MKYSKHSFLKLGTAAMVAGTLICSSLSADAKPARKDAHVLTNADGSTLTIVKRGNARSNTTYTADGLPLLRDAEGNYVYATIGADGTLQASNIHARDAKYRSAAENAMLSTMSEDAIQQAVVKTHTSKPRNSAQRVQAKGPGLSSTTFPSKGEQKGLIILVEFTDVKFNQYNSAAYQGDDIHTYYSEMLNKEGFSAHGSTGSARDWFIDNSNGLFIPEFDVYGPVALTSPMATYGGNDYWGNDKAPEKMVIEACQKLDAEINFADYDRDNDGWVDNIYVIYAGYGEADSYLDNTVWPHSWSISEACGGASKNNYRFDGKRIDHYACSNETDYYAKRPDGIGTFVHEFSHVLGLPDLYCTQDTYPVPFTPGAFSVLDYGPYNNDGLTPPNYSAYERLALDWMEVTEFPYTGEFELENLADSNFAYLVTTPVDREYFLFENRQLKGWDRYLPGHGMLVWHIDALQSQFDNNTVNNKDAHQYVDLVEADNKKNDNDQSGDTFPGSKNITSYGANTVPALKSWAGKTLGIDLSNIAENDGLITFFVQKEGSTGIGSVAAESNLATVSGTMLTANEDVKVYSLTGQQVAALQSGDSAELSAGIYVVRGADSSIKVALR